MSAVMFIFFWMFVQWFVGTATSSTISCETCCSIFGFFLSRGLASSSLSNTQDSVV